MYVYVDRKFYVDASSYVISKLFWLSRASFSSCVNNFFLWPARVQMRTAGVSNQLDTFAVREDSKLDTFALGGVVPSFVEMYMM